MELLRHHHLDNCVARYQHITDCILEAAHDRGLEGRGIMTADDLQAALSKCVATYHLSFEVMCCAVPCCAVLCRAVLCRAVWCHAVAMPCCALLGLCRAVPCWGCAMPCCAIRAVTGLLSPCCITASQLWKIAVIACSTHVPDSIHGRCCHSAATNQCKRASISKVT